MKALIIADIVSVILLLVFGAWAMLFLKRHKNEPLEELRKPLLVAVNIIIVLTVVTAILSILAVIFRNL